jgi:hypothetical protein
MLFLFCYNILVMFNLEDSNAAIILIPESIISINLETPKAVVILKKKKSETVIVKNKYY